MVNNHFNGITRALATLFILCLLAGCGGSSGSKTVPANSETESLISFVGWYFENTAPDYFNNGATCSLVMLLYYSESITKDDMESASITAPNGTQWAGTLSSSNFSSSSTGKPYIITDRLLYKDNPQTFPLAGTWTAEIILKNGKSSSFKRTFHEPGSSDDATHTYLYTQEDWMPSTNPSQYIAALYRFPSQGYTIQYSADNGGRITSTGFSAVRSSFLTDEPRTYNMYCWLFDASTNYLGRSNPEYSMIDHSGTNLITADGEMLITPASTISTTGNVDLSKVKYIRIVNIDGGQYAPLSHSSFDNRSVSSFITVN